MDRTENALALRPVRLSLMDNDRPRDQQAARMLALQTPLSEICATLGYPDEDRTLQGIKRAMADATRFARDEYRYMELLGLDELELRLWRLVEADMPMVDRGQLVRGSDGQPIQDLRFQKEIMAEVRQVKAQRCKLLGLNAPTRVESISMEMINDEIKRLETEVGRHTEYADGG
jgi:hypothetical protein